MDTIELNDFETFALVDSIKLLAPIKSITITSNKTLVGKRKVLAVVSSVDGKITKLDITDYGNTW